MAIRKYEAVFYATQGLGPWGCFFCKELVTLEGLGRERLNIHHEDGDETNHQPDNLKATHSKCHAKHHFAGKQGNDKQRAAARENVKIAVLSAHTPEANAKRKESLKRWRANNPEKWEEFIKDSAEKRRGQKRTDEQIKNIKEGQQKALRYCECGLGPMTAGSLFRHKKGKYVH